MDLFSADFLRGILISAPGILFGLTVHEFCHAWVADKFGDHTAAAMGRLTLNPLKHLDPIGTLMLFIAHIGWAKPVPVDPRNLRNPLKDMVFISFAGPASNLITGIVLGLILRLTLPFFLGASPNGWEEVLLNILYLAVFYNFILAMFNLIPIPPLDGAGIVRGLIPRRWVPGWLRFEQYGMFILLGIVFLDYISHIGIFYTIILQPVQALVSIIVGI